MPDWHKGSCPRCQLITTVFGGLLNGHVQPGMGFLGALAARDIFQLWPWFRTGWPAAFPHDGHVHVHPDNRAGPCAGSVSPGGNPAASPRAKPALEGPPNLSGRSSGCVSSERATGRLASRVARMSTSFGSRAATARGCGSALRHPDGKPTRTWRGKLRLSRATVPCLLRRVMSYYVRARRYLALSIAAAAACSKPP